MHFQVNIYCMGGRQGELMVGGGGEGEGGREEERDGNEENSPQ